MKDSDKGEYREREREDGCSSSGKKRRSKMEEGKRGEGIARACTECGKKFWSWKALFGHMRCHPERQWRGINPPPNFRRQQQQHNTITPEDHEVAASLLLLANSNANAHKLKGVMAVEDCSVECPSQFECSSCNKVFGSHQALGGHRASHKNVKGCFAVTTSRMTWTQGQGVGADTFVADHQQEPDPNPINVMMLGIGEEGEGDESGGHKCSICLRVFNTGQALGGHKRCHWDRGDNLIDPSPTTPKSLVDLNLPLHDHHPNPCSSSPLTLDLRLGL